MGRLHTIVGAIRNKDFATTAAELALVMEKKVARALNEEKKRLAATLVSEAPSKPLPKRGGKDPNRDENDEPICQDCGKPGSKCGCEPHGNFVEEWSGECGKCGGKLWKTASGRSWCRECGTYDKNLGEELISQKEVQRVLDEVGDVGETELLCGIRNLHVNPSGQVISYVCEATATPFPSGWDKGWSYPYRIGAGGSERPFIKDGRWYLHVWNQETSKKEVYSFYDDVFIPEKEFFKESVDEDMSFKPKVKLASGTNYKVPAGTQGRLVRGRGTEHSFVSFPKYGTIEVRNKDIKKLYEDVERRDVGQLVVTIETVKNYNGAWSYIAKTYVPDRSGMTKSGEESKPQPSVRDAVLALRTQLSDKRRVTGRLTIAPSNTPKTQTEIDRFLRQGLAK